MVTEVIMQREILGSSVKQKSKSGFFLLNDLLAIGNKYRVANQMKMFSIDSYYARESTKEFIDEIEKKYGVIKNASRGANGGTWIHPLLFIDIALEISPSLKVEVYEWLFDSLIKYRNDSGDSYKEMSAAIFKRSQNHKEFPKLIAGIADYVRIYCTVTNWQKATEAQLKKRDSIHKAIILYSNVLTDPKQIVRLSCETAI